MPLLVLVSLSPSSLGLTALLFSLQASFASFSSFLPVPVPTLETEEREGTREGSIRQLESQFQGK